MSRSNNWIYRPLAEPLAFDGHLLLVDDGIPLAVIDSSARLLWNLVAAGHDSDHVFSVLAKHFKQPRDTIEADFGPMIDHWINLGLIEKQRTKAPPTSSPIFDDCFQIGDWPVRLRCHAATYAVKIEALYGPSRIKASSPVVGCLDFGQDDDGYYVARNGKIVVRTDDQGHARGGLFIEFLRLSAPGHSWLACLHASAVGDDERCLIFSGDCGAGKTTLTLGMMNAGYDLLADDMLPIDGDDRLIWPLPFAMSLKPGTVKIGLAMFEAIADLPDIDTDRGPVRHFFPAGQTRDFAKGGLPAFALIFPQYDPDAELSLRPLDRTEALQNLLANGSALDLTGYHLRETLSWLQDLPCYKLDYSDLNQAVDRLNDFWSEL